MQQSLLLAGREGCLIFCVLYSDSFCLHLLEIIKQLYFASFYQGLRMTLSEAFGILRKCVCPTEERDLAMSTRPTLNNSEFWLCVSGDVRSCFLILPFRGCMASIVNARSKGMLMQPEKTSFCPISFPFSPRWQHFC